MTCGCLSRFTSQMIKMHAASYDIWMLGAPEMTSQSRNVATLQSGPFVTQVSASIPGDTQCWNSSKKGMVEQLVSGDCSSTNLTAVCWAPSVC